MQNIVIEGLGTQLPGGRVAKGGSLFKTEGGLCPPGQKGFNLKHHVNVKKGRVYK